MTELWNIVGGKVYDPANGIAGEVRELWIRDGRIVAAPQVAKTDSATFGTTKSAPPEVPYRTLDATGYVVFPGGIDMHSHVAGGKVNTGRAMLPEARRTGKHYEAAISQNSEFLPPGSLGIVPTTLATGYRYCGLGYTTVFDAAVAPLLARLAHRDLDEIPNLDTGCYLLVGNDRRLLELLASNRREDSLGYLAWLLNVARGYALKVVNPGGVESWKQGRSGDFADLDQELPDLPLTPRRILREIAELAVELKLPHPAHIHCNNLGHAGNYRTTLETMRTLAGLPAHLTHIQFHSYSGGVGDEGSFGSGVGPLVDWFNSHPELSVDVGQALFGPTISMTGDSAAAQYLARITGGRRFNHDLAGCGGCGVIPVEYKQHSLIHAWQFAIGLEWYLTAADPWRLALTTDHPNGAVFWRYPTLIRLLMDSAYRREVWQTLPRRVRERSTVAKLEREYSLAEICILTRAAPARLLGLADRGHLGPGAVADLAIYAPSDNYEEMFSVPVYTIHAGEIVVERGELRQLTTGTRLQATNVLPELLHSAGGIDLADWMAENLEMATVNFAFGEE
ncbi:MAG: formylmethanofuran dehydrogenase subunit A [Pirellulales bacterium]|nr:formylmethanofuran dehydrogenase subunit A [Pirellulales bacterium]